jgi:putative transposase
MTSEERKSLIEPEHTQLSVRSQCALLGLCRASYYYEPEEDRTHDFELMHLIDREYLEHPFYGSRRMAVALKEGGYFVNRKRVQRLMREMGLEAIYPKRNLSKPGEPEIKFPYLMRGLSIDRPNKAWCADITYIPLQEGFGYCIAVMDWWSRWVLAWRISNSMDVNFCLEALEEAFSKGKPEIFNTDQGSQFTSALFVEALLREQILVSWDGRGRALDNIFIERLWRSLKYEEVYLREYKGLNEARAGIGKYFEFYNTERPHQALRYQTPKAIHFGQF